ncbi:hypothetical protein LCGC14_2240870 [marine sediment metagenome]|uniref:Uncharacterized protein n=1 Tax=marine sediment metagenome TaxID=412755 RepID=A0A0F9D578_9ZZZZ
MEGPNTKKILDAIPAVLREVKSMELGGVTYVVIPIQVWGALEAAYEDIHGQILPEDIRNMSDEVRTMSNEEIRQSIEEIRARRGGAK